MANTFTTISITILLIWQRQLVYDILYAVVSKFQLIFSLFLFFKLLIACIINVGYFYVMSREFFNNYNSYELTKRAFSFFMMVCVPFIFHSLISKWEFTLYLAFPINLVGYLAVMIQPQNDRKFPFHVARNLIFWIILMAIVF